MVYLLEWKQIEKGDVCREEAGKLVEGVHCSGFFQITWNYLMWNDWTYLSLCNLF